MKFRLITIALIAVLIVLTLMGVSINPKNSFTIVASSYVDSSTSLYNYKGKNLVETSTYPIGGVESIDYNNNRLMFNRYGDKVISNKNDDEFKLYKVKANPQQIEKYKEKQYILYNEGVNLFSISIYDNDYNILKSSGNFSGYARNYLINNDIIYVLANVYEQNLNRSVGVYAIDIASLEVLSFTELEGLTFGFYMERFNNEIEIYGNSNEEAQDLAIYTYDLVDLKTNLLVKSDIKAMWVNKVIVVDNKKIILNQYSIISLDESGTLKKEFINKGSFIDFEYDKSDEIYYVLIGDFEDSVFEVLKLKKNFEVIERIPLAVGDKTPTDLELN
jgi:hypothetical protein